MTDRNSNNSNSTTKDKRSISDDRYTNSNRSTYDERSIYSGDLFLHFKNRMYQVVTVAIHSETEEPLVIYQALYGDYKVYARPLELFLSEVDHTKYPDVKQKYRFEKVERNTLQEQEEKQQASQKEPEQEKQQNDPKEEIKERRKEQSGNCETAHDWLLKFLDADTYEEKSALLKDVENEITDRMINNLAAALDVVIPEGALEERYRQLRICIDTKKRYEIGRMR